VSATLKALNAVLDEERTAVPRPVISDAVASLFPSVSPVRCYRERDVLKLVPISRSKFSELCKQGRGPRVIRVGAAKLFRETDLVEWLAGLYGESE
jgi:predicted DNA-binding transcriptional regulator AlpA